LTGKNANCLLIARISGVKITNATKRPTAKKTRDGAFRFVIEKHWDKTPIALGIVGITFQKGSFPIDTFTLFWGKITVDSPGVLPRANTKHEIRALRTGLLIAPPRPVHDLVLMKLVEFDVDILLP